MKDGKVVVVIGHRMGQGHNVAKGVEKAGGIAIVIPGMAADMRLGQVMQENDADFGISFCGSGGAGALAAGNAYGWKIEYGLHSVEAACTALEHGCKVVGLGFMDTEELGYRTTMKYKELHGIK
jgi:uncharacterized protein (TIGR03577 family)